VTNERSEENLLLLRHLLELPINDSASKSEQKAQARSRSLMTSWNSGQPCKSSILVTNLNNTSYLLSSRNRCSHNDCDVICKRLQSEDSIYFVMFTEMQTLSKIDDKKTLKKQSKWTIWRSTFIVFVNFKKKYVVLVFSVFLYKSKKCQCHFSVNLKTDHI